MQYIEYQYAKERGIVGQIIYKWMKNVDLNIHTKGKVISDWRKGRLLLNIKDGTFPLSRKSENEWVKTQANRSYHNKAYMQAYLEGVWKL